MKKLLPILLLAACASTGPQITTESNIHNCEPKGALIAIKPEPASYVGHGYTAMTRILKTQAQERHATDIVISDKITGSNFLLANAYNCGAGNGK